MTKVNNKNPRKERKMLNLQIGNQITFKALNTISGEEVKRTGTIIGGAEKLRKMFPDEYGEAEDCYLVKAKDIYGNEEWHVVMSEDVIAKEEK